MKNGNTSVLVAGTSNMSEAVMRALKEVQGSGKSTLVKVIKPLEAPVFDAVETAVKKPVVRKVVSTLSSLKALKPRVSASKVDKAKVILEAKERKDFLHFAVSEYDQICLKLAELASIEDANSSDKYVELVEEKARIEEVLASQPEGIQSQFALNLLSRGLTGSTQHRTMK